MTDVVVIGGGIAGLCAAAEVARAGVSVTVLDAHGLGGRARTTEVDGYELNVGPHAIYLAGALFGLLAELRIDVPGQTPPTDVGWLLVGETLHQLPGGPRSLLTTTALSARSKLRAGRLLASLPRLDTAALVGTSVSTWLADLPADLRRVFDGLVRVSSYTDLPDEFDAGGRRRPDSIGAQARGAICRSRLADNHRRASSIRSRHRRRGTRACPSDRRD